jgi:hypothetical protein
MSDTTAIQTIEPQAPARSAGTAIESERVVAETKGAIFVAKSYPRDVFAARERILAACRRPTLAEAAMYAYPKGGETVTGPSIRLAEAIAQAWGNISFGVRELEKTDRETTYEAQAWDVEGNIRAYKTFSVPHTRYTKKGSYDLTDPRDIYEVGANQASRRVRACILALIPGDIVEDAVKECERTQENAMGATDQALKNVVAAFGALGVSPRQLETRLGHNLQATIVAEILGLRKIYQAIKDGFTTVEETFPSPEPEKKSAKDVAAEKAAAKGVAHE